MRFAKKETGGASLGLADAIGQAGNISGCVIVAILFADFAVLATAETFFFPFRSCFFSPRSLGLWPCGVCFYFLYERATRRTISCSASTFLFCEKFTTYYFWKCFTAPENRYFTFAPYVLILQYGADASFISLLMAICPGFGVVSSPVHRQAHRQGGLQNHHGNQHPHPHGGMLFLRIRPSAFSASHRFYRSAHQLRA
jgi:hypothetical protein